MRPVAALIAAAGLGCIDDVGFFDPQVGEPIAVRCSDDDSDPGEDVSFAEDLLPLFRGDLGPESCTCHFPGSTNPIGIDQSGLDLSSLDSLLAGGANSGGQIVVRGSPCTSILWQKVSPGPPFGARMPFGGPFLSDAQIQSIADWISEGARE